MQDFLANQKKALHRTPGTSVEAKSNIVGDIMGLVVSGMVSLGYCRGMMKWWMRLYKDDAIADFFKRKCLNNLNVPS